MIVSAPAVPDTCTRSMSQQAGCQHSAPPSPARTVWNTSTGQAGPRNDTAQSVIV